MRRLNDILDLEARRSKLEAGSPPDADAPAGTPPAPEEGDTLCQTCHGARFVYLDVPLDDPQFGKAVPCHCASSDDTETRLARLQRYSNLGPLTRLTFESLIRRGRSADPRDQARFQRCAEDAERFAKDPHGWLVLVGPSGCGKTHVAAAIANRSLELGTPALFVVVPDLLDHLRAAYKPDADIGYDQLFEQVREAPVLILDDLGTQSATPWAQEKLFQIINHRYNARLPTVITTNVPLSKFDERIRSRLNDPGMEQPHADVVAVVYTLETRRPPELRELNMLDMPAIREMTFESFDLNDSRSERDKTWRQDAYRHALDYASKPEGWMVLIGGRARDRTQLIAAIGNHARKFGESPLLVRVSELLDFLRQGMDAEEYTFYGAKKSVRAHPFLLLDQLQVGMGSQFTREQLFDLLEWRSFQRLPTVITTPSQVQQLLSDPGWTRLARLMVNSAGFCSEVLVGETPAEEEDGSASTSSARKTGRSAPKRR